MSVRQFVGVLLLIGPVACAHAQTTGPLAVEDRSVASGNAGADSGVSDDGLMLLMQQLQQYEQEIATLRGQLEELSFQVERMREAERQRYLDLDARINALSAAPVASPTPKSEAAGTARPAVDPEADRAAYMAARDKLLASDFAAAIKQFEAYLGQFQGGQFRAFAHFWLGEAYRNRPQPDRAKAMEHFQQVVDGYPESSKVPSALYKIAVLQAEAGDPARAKVTLNKILLQYPKASDATLARSMLDQLEAAN